MYNERQKNKQIFMLISWTLNRVRSGVAAKGADGEEAEAEETPLWV